MITANVLIVGVALALVAYYGWMWTNTLHTGSVGEWVDKDFPEIVHTPKPTWLVGFYYKKHGIQCYAKLDIPVFIDYDKAEHLGRFSVTGAIAEGGGGLYTKAQKAGKDLVTYDFEMQLEQLTGGKLAIETMYKQISITEIEPAIEENACEEPTYCN